MYINMDVLKFVEGGKKRGNGEYNGKSKKGGIEGGSLVDQKGGSCISEEGGGDLFSGIGGE